MVRLPWLRLAFLVAASATLACSVPVAAALDEDDANRIVVALDHEGVDGTKEIDPQAEGKFRVLVPRDDVAHALSTMKDEELPRPRTTSVLDAMDKGALVPSAQAEHAQYVAGLAGDLQRTLEGIDGVLVARVHLNVPPPDPLRDGPPAKTTASVLLEHRGSAPPLTNDAVQRLVAGGVPNLVPADVTVVTIARPAPAAHGEPQLAHFGPIAVARGSATTLKIVFAAAVAALALLAGITLSLVSRLSRARAERDDAKKPG
ncbi:type III secretion inner membrane ring lipoprotein SctJ [soil metagenome]